MQVVTEHQEERVEQHDKELKEQVHLGLQLRREVFALRDRLTSNVDLLSDARDRNHDNGITAVIEAKFGQLDALVAQLQSNVAFLGDREGFVARTVEQIRSDQPSDGLAIATTFAGVGAEFVSVTERIQRLETSSVAATSAVRAPAAGAASDTATPFTAAMREQAEYMLTRISDIDALRGAVKGLYDGAPMVGTRLDAL